MFGTCQPDRAFASAHNIISWQVIYPCKLLQYLPWIGQEAPATNVIGAVPKREAPRIAYPPQLGFIAPDHISLYSKLSALKDYVAFNGRQKCPRDTGCINDPVVISCIWLRITHFGALKEILDESWLVNCHKIRRNLKSIHDYMI